MYSIFCTYMRDEKLPRTVDLLSKFIANHISLQSKREIKTQSHLPYNSLGYHYPTATMLNSPYILLFVSKGIKSKCTRKMCVFYCRKKRNDQTRLSLKSGL